MERLGGLSNINTDMKKLIITILLFLLTSCAYTIKEDRHYNSKSDTCDSTKFNCIDVRYWR